jgi:hypothetical protein
VHRSRRRQPVERAIAVLAGGMRRCHECNARYARFGSSWLRITDLNRISRKLFLIFAMIMAAALILAATLWFSHDSPSDGAANYQTKPAAFPNT